MSTTSKERNQASANLVLDAERTSAVRGPSRGGRKLGAKTWTNSMVEALLDAIDMKKPIGPEQWQDVHRLYSNTSSDTTRTVESLRRKWNQLCGTKKKTGDPDCPPLVARAKRLFWKINGVVSAEVMGGDDENSNDASQESEHDVELPLAEKNGRSLLQKVAAIHVLAQHSNGTGSEKAAIVPSLRELVSVPADSGDQITHDAPLDQAENVEVVSSPDIVGPPFVASEPRASPVVAHKSVRHALSPEAKIANTQAPVAAQSASTTATVTTTVTTTKTQPVRSTTDLFVAPTESATKRRRIDQSFSDLTNSLRESRGELLRFLVMQEARREEWEERRRQEKVEEDMRRDERFALMLQAILRSGVEQKKDV
eukprot:GILJ01003043.1.p2 GENE.GILJ01003043.1~~GILJ01003043.1.p2  ORF type:complete len:369 (-),score=42.61 GILJ01003043.1:1531-2637(-)